MGIFYEDLKAMFLHPCYKEGILSENQSKSVETQLSELHRSMFATQEKIAGFVVDAGAIGENDDPLWGAFDQALQSRNKQHGRKRVPERI